MARGPGPAAPGGRASLEGGRARSARAPARASCVQSAPGSATFAASLPTRPRLLRHTFAERCQFYHDKQGSRRRQVMDFRSAPAVPTSGGRLSLASTRSDADASLTHACVTPRAPRKRQASTGHTQLPTSTRRQNRPRARARARKEGMHARLAAWVVFASSLQTSTRHLSSLHLAQVQQPPVGAAEGGAHNAHASGLRRQQLHDARLLG